MENNKTRFLSGNVLKIIGLISMVIDHVGYMFFENCMWLRIIGRLSFPIFAFMIAEGCKYTSNKLKYFLSVFVVALVCQVGVFVFDGSTKIYSLMSLAISIPIIYLLQLFKKSLFNKDKSKYVYGILFILSIVTLYFLNKIIEIDYGFFGTILVVLTSLFKREKGKEDNLYLDLILMGIGLILLAKFTFVDQYYALLSLPILGLYSGKRGKLNMKWFFYLFYPLHFVVLELIYLIIYH